MDNEVLRLLFDFNGKISSREYLKGIIILFVASSCITGFFLLGYQWNFILSKFVNIETLVSKNMLDIFFAGFIPVMVPLNFIVFYSSMVISIKRCRDNLLGIKAGIFLGILTFIFFADLSNSAKKISYFFLQNNHLSFHLPISLKTASIIILSIFVSGMASILFLYFYKLDKEEQLKSCSMNQDRFIFFMGKLMAASVAAVVIAGCVFFLIYKNGNIKASVNFISISLALIFFINFIVYLIISYKRIQDAGYNGYLVIIFFVSVIILSAVSYGMVYFERELLNLIISEKISEISTSLNVLFIFLCFILPSARENFNTSVKPAEIKL